jgi:hypothetical protein
VIIQKSDKRSARTEEISKEESSHQLDDLDITKNFEARRNGTEFAITPQVLCDATTKTFNVPPLLFQSSPESASSNSPMA